MDCPYCKTEMRLDDRDYYVCGQCLGEFWPGEIQKERGEYQKRQIKHDPDSPFYFGLADQTTAINSKPVLPAGVPIRKGGSKNGKARKKKGNKRKIMLEI